ncbi:MAG: polysaccharide deacetylase family protein [Ahrensia sp.]|nr:polysaccharide deacetylase family protein [Ahrensia sp.]
MTVSKTLMRKAFMIGARYTGLTHIVSPLLSGQGAILMLHRVGKPLHKSGINNFLSVDGGFLNFLLEELKRAGYKFVSMDEAVDRIKARHSNEKFLTVTLDDGYRDNLLTAAPIFTNHNVPYMIYACTGFCSATSFLWWEILAQIVETAATHSHTHPTEAFNFLTVAARQKKTQSTSV